MRHKSSPQQLKKMKFLIPVPGKTQLRRPTLSERPESRTILSHSFQLLLKKSYKSFCENFFWNGSWKWPKNPKQFQLHQELHWVSVFGIFGHFHEPFPPKVFTETLLTFFLEGVRSCPWRSNPPQPTRQNSVGFGSLRHVGATQLHFICHRV